MSNRRIQKGVEGLRNCLDFVSVDHTVDHWFSRSSYLR
jgi:hypothetical protein